MTGMAICRMTVMQRITGRIGKNGMQKGSMHMNDRKMVLDGMMGLVVGDALGCPVQFLDREELRERGAVTKMEGYGTYNMPPGTWTDDSSMALATLASINEQNRIDLRDIMERFLDLGNFMAHIPPSARRLMRGIPAAMPSISIATATTSQPAAKRANTPTATAH